MTKRGFSLATALFAGLAATTAGGPARAGSTATRCDETGCVHIHCNSTGDRCYRYEGGYGTHRATARCYDCESDEYHAAGGDDRYPNLLCDADGDRCYPSRHRHWDYREDYRRLGFHWDDEGSPE
jgi:hypothetical protein